MSLLTVQEAADLLKVSTSWIRRHLSELPVVPMPGQVVRIDKDRLQVSMESRKSLKPEEPTMVNRFQRGSWKVRGKKKMVYGRFRLETLDANGEREFWHGPLGLRKEFATESAIQKKLDAVMDEMLKPGAVPPSAKTMTFFGLAEEWKLVKGPGIKAKSSASYKHWCDALRSYIYDWHLKDEGKAFKDRLIANIQQKDVVQLLNGQAAKYSRSSLRSMRGVLRKVLLYAQANGYIQRAPNWLDKMTLAKAHGRKLVRAKLTPQQTLSFVNKLKEPYSTLVLLLAALGLRGEAAVGLQPTDLDAEDVLHVRRVIYNREVVPLRNSEEVEIEECYPLSVDVPVHADLLQRLRSVGAGAKWIFHGRTGNPLDLGNARKRKLHKVESSVGVKVGGWHDFRHALVHSLYKSQEVRSKIISKLVGHSSEAFTAKVYDHAEQSEIREALAVVGRRLEPKMEPNRVFNETNP
jgi:integrase